VDRSGLGPVEIRLHTLLDGAETLASVAARAGIAPEDAAAVALGLELAGQLERRVQPSVRQFRCFWWTTS